MSTLTSPSQVILGPLGARYGHLATQGRRAGAFVIPAMSLARKAGPDLGMWLSA